MIFKATGEFYQLAMVQRALKVEREHTEYVSCIFESKIY